MRARIVSILLAALLLLPATAFSQTVPYSSPPEFGLGFGPLSIVPVNVGTPIFTPGDQIWIQSYLNSTVLLVSLASPKGISTPALFLDPGALIMLHTFTPSDPLGEWRVSATTYSTGAVSSANVTLAEPTLALSPQLTGANLTDNSLGLSYSIPPSAGYDIQECAIGSGGGPSASFQLPASLGGSMQISVLNDSAIFSGSGSVSQFSAWAELYTERSYVEGVSLVSQLSMAAESGVVTLAIGSGQMVANFTNELNLRAGRYEVLAFVRGPQGLTLFESPYLKENDGTWLSLNDCTELTEVTTGTFFITSDLDNVNSTWPRSLYTMYDDAGVELYNVSKVPTSEARIDVRNAIQDDKIVGVDLNASGAGIQSWDSFSSGIYIIGNEFPLVVTIQANFQGIAYENLNVTILSPFTSVPLPVTVGSLDIQTAYQGGDLGNVTISVSVPGSPPAIFHTDRNGGASFTLPPGRYQVNATYSGKTASETVQVLAGGLADANLDLGGQAFPSVLFFLVVAFVIGAALNFFIWRSYHGRRETYK